MASAVEMAIRSVVAKGLDGVAELNRRRMPKADHPFLTGIHAPMTEEKTLAGLPVTGTIPAGLVGRYLRIGPNPVAPDAAGYHWFIGDGMVHAVELNAAAAPSYRNRWIRSRDVAAALGEAPAPGPRHNGFDSVNTNILRIGGRDRALVEATSFPVTLDETLELQTYDDFAGTLQGAFTAHPHLDPLTGDHHAITYEAMDPKAVRHVVISPEGRVVREQPIPVKHGPSIHDCAITARYVVILDLPVTFSMRALIGGHRFPFEWNPKHQARVGLLPRDGAAKDVIWCDVDPAYVFHVANAYDAPDGRVVLDVCAYSSMFAEKTGGPTGRNLGLERWTIDPSGGGVERRTVDAAPQEFPRIDERRFGQPYRYAYAMGLPEEETPQLLSATRLYRHDLLTDTRQTHEFGPGRHPGEFVFVPAHADAAEDEGWLVGLVVDIANDTTDLAIIDARDFAASPVATVRLPHRVPPGFHGNWFPAT